MKHALFLLTVLAVCTGAVNSCGSSKQKQPSEKISFDLSEFTDDGLRERPKGEFNAISYEFCIPADEETLNEVKKIDTTLSVYKTSKGRSGCSDKEWLCIGKSHRAGFKSVILKLASLRYIRKISETFWE
jgi:hypothetical protein